MDGCQHAVTQVLAEHADRHLLQGPGDRADLDHHIGAPGVSLDHLLQTADLTLDLPQAPKVVLFAGGVAALGPAGAGSGRMALAGLQQINVGGDGGHRPLPLPAGLRSLPDASTSRSRRYSSASISPLARRSSRMRCAPLPLYSSPRDSAPGRRVTVMARAYTAQISKVQNAIMPTHIR